MPQVLNLLYCFDSNYNFQAFTSIFSFLEKSSEKISLNIIHKDTSKKDIFPENILKHSNLNELNIYRFDRKFQTFPKVENSHVSEATYYRLFFNDYIKNIEDFESITYVDCDMICLKDPSSEIIENSKNLVESEYVLAARKEKFETIEMEKIIKNLNLSSSRYMNAGLLIIDVNKWINENLTQKLCEKLLQIENNIVFWDQDVFNAYLDGAFYELPESLNCYTNLEDNLTVSKEVKIVHYYGNKKPWTTKGIFNKKSTYYQDMFRELGLGNYHITHKRRRDSVRHLIRGIFNLNIIYVKKPASFLIDFLISMSKKPNII